MLLNLLNELRKGDKMRGLLSISSGLNNFNNTGARMFESIYHMTFLKLLKNCILGVKKSRYSHLFTQRYSGRHYATLLNL